MKPITKEWFDRASDDLETIKQLLEQKHLTSVIVFHAQQAVEKVFKGVIEEFALGFVKTHDLVRLYELVKPHYAIVHDIKILEQLGAAYTESRYPDNVGFLPYGKPSLEEAKRLYSFAKDVYQQITHQLQ